MVSSGTSVTRRLFMCGCCATRLVPRAAFAADQNSRPLFAAPLGPISAAQHLDSLKATLRLDAIQARSAIRGQVKAEWGDVIDEVHLRFSAASINNAAAFNDPITGDRIVKLFAGMIIVVEQIALARSFSTISQYAATASDYLIYLAIEVDFRRKNPSSIFTRPAIKTWFEYINMLEIVEAQAFYSENPNVRRLFDTQMACSIAFALGHELGHHILNHPALGPPSSSEESRTREEAADDIGLKLVAGTAFPALGAVPVFLSFFIADPEGGTSLSATHPDPLRRILKVVKGSFQTLLDDQSFVNELKKTGRYNEFFEQNSREFSEFEKLINKLQH